MKKLAMCAMLLCACLVGCKGEDGKKTGSAAGSAAAPAPTSGSAATGS